MKKLKSTKGVTLIALVVTIIVLLILAGITISMVAGQNGIMTKAKEAKVQTEIAEVKERARVDILGEQAGNEGEITKEKFVEILSKYFNDVPAEENLPQDLETLILESKEEYGGHNIKISEIYDGKFPIISPTLENLKVGDKLLYDTGVKSIGYDGIIECLVLYDHSYSVRNNLDIGVQILPSNNMYDNKRGEVELNLGGQSLEGAVEDYNNYIRYLAQEVEYYLNTDVASDVRIIGSDPLNPRFDVDRDDEDYWIIENFNGFEALKQEWSNKIKLGRFNSMRDEEQLKKTDFQGSNFCYAGRDSQFYDGQAYFYLGLGHGKNSWHWGSLFALDASQDSQPMYNYEVRGAIIPVFRLRDDVWFEWSDVGEGGWMIKSSMVR